ncbi:hypothetical protein F5890DRAFT_1534734 [Lentinula detonsa]|uniref:DDE Tnp4 domain-containing protein n=1 Tax=Lentinula detonsa TaxID=2804962 RepID=A0AA38UPD6_9AGAR|nr:hypothetical protein F5890DRAFT_1534734 [Lentinula detonsa]
MKDFNFKLSKQRITVEHAFGCLKLRFRSLQMMGAHENVQDAWRAIDSLMIVHNMCLYYDDQPAQLDDYSEDIHDDGIGDWDGDILPEMTQNNVGGPADIPHSERAASLRVEGYRLRNELMDIVCPAAEYQQ